MPSTKQESVLLANSIRETPTMSPAGLMPVSDGLPRQSRSDSYVASVALQGTSIGLKLNDCAALRVVRRAQAASPKLAPDFYRLTLQRTISG